MVSQDEESPQDEVSSKDEDRTKKHAAMGILGLLSSGALWATVRAIIRYWPSKEESTVQSVPPRPPSSNLTFVPPKPFELTPPPSYIPPSLYSPGVVKDLSVDDVPFYYCRAEIQPPSKSLVLLQGYNSTRDTWLENRIMQDFCSNGSFEVLSIETPVGATYEKLESLLDSLEAGGLPTGWLMEMLKRWQRMSIHGFLWLPCC
jgi:hypothetical protein